MSLARHAKQRDANEGDILSVLHALGWMTVQHDAYDLEAQCPRCGSPPFHLSFEVKSLKPRRPLTPAQKELRRRGWFFRVVREEADVIDAIEAHYEKHHHG